MKKETTKFRGFRLWAETAKRLEWATTVGLNGSEIVNKVLADHLREYLEKAKAEKALDMSHVSETAWRAGWGKRSVAVVNCGRQRASRRGCLW